MFVYSLQPLRSIYELLLWIPQEIFSGHWHSTWKYMMICKIECVYMLFIWLDENTNLSRLGVPPTHLEIDVNTHTSVIHIHISGLLLYNFVSVWWCHHDSLTLWLCITCLQVCTFVRVLVKPVLASVWTSIFSYTSPGHHSKTITYITFISRIIDQQHIYC
jgi:hypothetical protein